MANGPRFSGAAPALVRHLIGILGALLVAGFIAGVWLTNVQNSVEATENKASENRKTIEAIKESMNELSADQKVLLQRFDDDKAANKEFRDRTGNALERILERLPRREGPPR